MSVCSCDYGRYVLGACIMRNRTARTIPKRGNVCPNCKNPVEIGQPCIDHAGLYADDDGGFFGRFHPECWELMEQWADKMCGGSWSWPLDLDEAAEHALAHSDEPFWKEWLLLYEETWKYKLSQGA